MCFDYVETTRTRYLQVFAGVTGFFAEHTVSHKMLDLLGNHKARYCGYLARFAHCYAGGRRNFFQILIRNENPTHSHLTTRAEAASYLTTKTLPIDDQDGEDVKTLADARASPKQITNFLNKRIGKESEFGKKEAERITPQQTRNLIRISRPRFSRGAFEKKKLHALLQLEGSDVLVIQDQMDVTCGIVMQTKMHKLLFERWGETLAMDFTHGTDHLGYHLGTSRICRAVTSCTCLAKSISSNCYQLWRLVNDGVCHPRECEDELAAAADSLPSIVQMSKLKSPKVRLPYGLPYVSPNGHQTNDEGRAVPASKPTKQVVYFRFHRNERANQVVLSSAEKYSYAKAIPEPLLEICQIYQVLTSIKNYTQ
ncbi:hypothetical protein GQ600_3799 [Phytophthora cactorum]|nr:hypothetical protein GQ600_3799 [Phytophthora cactorum]